jgi:peroxiredoxin Q/BCP
VTSLRVFIRTALIPFALIPLFILGCNRNSIITFPDAIKPEDKMLHTGDKAPDISLPDTDMRLRTLADFAAKTVLLYFYPKDDTPGCTLQANEFTDLIDEFEGAGVQIIGVSGDNCFSHQAFRDKFGLKITLLADVELEVCQKYGVIQEREKDGVKKTGIVRSSFVINPEGTIIYAEYGVTPKDHARNLLDFVTHKS